MTLAGTALRRLVRIQGISGDRSFRRRLLELGLTPGTRVEPIAVAPLGDPIELRVRGASLSIRRSEAELVAVAALDKRSESAELDAATDVEPAPASVSSTP